MPMGFDGGWARDQGPSMIQSVRGQDFEEIGVEISNSDNDDLTTSKRDPMESHLP